MACPHVAGVLALGKSVNMAADRRHLLQCMADTAMDTDGSNSGTYAGKLGAGLVNAEAFVECAANGAPSKSPTVSPAPTTAAPSLRPTISPAPTPDCGCNQQLVFHLKTDLYPGETTYEFKALDAPAGCVDEGVLKGGPYGEVSHKYDVVVSEQVCVGVTYEFKVLDLFGDGLCCGQGEGGFELAICSATACAAARARAASSSLSRALRSTREASSAPRTCSNSRVLLTASRPGRRPRPFLAVVTTNRTGTTTSGTTATTGAGRTTTSKTRTLSRPCRSPRCTRRSPTRRSASSPSSPGRPRRWTRITTTRTASGASSRARTRKTGARARAAAPRARPARPVARRRRRARTGSTTTAIPSRRSTRATSASRSATARTRSTRCSRNRSSRRARTASTTSSCRKPRAGRRSRSASRASAPTGTRRSPWHPRPRSSSARCANHVAQTTTSSYHDHDHART